MNFKNKIFITFFVLLAFILFFNINNVFASVDFKHNDEDVSLPDFDYIDTSLYSIYYYDNSYYVIILKNCENYINNGYNVSVDSYELFWLYKYDNNSLITQSILYGSEQNLNILLRKYNPSNNSWEKPYGTVAIMRNVINSLNYTTADYFVSSNYNCYNAERKELVFHQPVTEIQGVTIPALETADQIPQAIVTTLKIMIPVGLVVLSIGLVVYLIKRVIYLLH